MTLAGCDGDASDEQTAITKAGFIAQASGSCSKTRKRIETEFTAYGESAEARTTERKQRANELTADEADEAAIDVAEKILIPAMRKQVVELRDLGIPNGDDDRVRALLTAFDEGIEKAEAHPERAATDGTEAFGKWRRLAAEYGLNGC